MTQSAVSRQISTLEEYLGTKLFARESRGIELTQDGRDYVERIGPAMEQIAAATGMLLARNRSSAVRVAAYPTFAGKWLIPRLKAFNQVNPGTQIKIRTSITPIDPETSALEVAIQLRPLSRTNPEFSRLLYRDVLQPFAPRLSSSNTSCNRRKTCCQSPCCLRIIESRIGRTGWRGRACHRRGLRETSFRVRC